MMNQDNIPLSCTRGLHFTRKVGVIDECFYCDSKSINGYPLHEGNVKLKTTGVHPAMMN